MTTAAATHRPIELLQPSAVAAHIRGFLAKTWGVVIASNPGPRQPSIELESQPIAQWSPKTEPVADLEAERQCRIFCRPIHTGFGEVAVRPMSPADAEMAQVFVTTLSGTSRYFRFFQALRCLSPAMLDRFIRVDHVTHVALAGVVNVDGRPTIVAEARYAVSTDGTSAEIALTVADQWQRRGLASELMATLERVAVAAGITRLTGECLAVNEGFAGLARSLGFRVYADASDRSLLQVEKAIGERSRTRNRSYLGGTRAIHATAPASNC
jgi:GNAT superfamily N-acetyltransferase